MGDHKVDLDQEVLDEDGEVVGCLYFVHDPSGGHWYRACAVYEDGDLKPLSRHRTIQAAEDEIKQYWGMK